MDKNNKKWIGILTFIMSLLSLIGVIVLIITSFDSKEKEKQEELNAKGSILVTFDSNGGSDVGNQLVKEGEKIVKPENPTKTGYTFDGWYSGDEKWSFIGYSIQDEVTLTAKWNINSYNISYDLNDDDSSIKALNNPSNPSTYTVEDDILFTNPTREGCVFMGWSVPSIEKGTTGNITITAEWSIEYLVFFDSNGGDFIETISASKDSTIDLPTPTRGTDTFAGWFDGSEYHTNSATIKRETTMIASWYEDFKYDENQDGSITITGYIGEGQTVVLPNNANSIGSNAFEDKAAITKIYLTDNIKHIGTYAFKGCESLEYASDDGNGLYLGNGDNEYLWLMQASTPYINYCLVNEKTKYIGPFAFDGCRNMSTITFPETIEYFGDYAFLNCSSLKTIDIPKNLNRIGPFAFYNCYLLNKVKITDLSKWCSIEFENSNSNPCFQTSENCSIYLNNFLLEELTIPSDIEKITPYAFYYCKSIKKLTIPGNVNEIGANAFYKCSNIIDVKLEEGVKKLDSNVFYECTSINNISLPESLTVIGDFCFYKCNRLLNISIPNGVNVIYANSFSSCSSLKYETGGNCKYLGNSTNKYLWLVDIEDKAASTYTIYENTKHIIPSVFDGITNATCIYYDGPVMKFKNIFGDIKFKVVVKCSDGEI